VSGRELIFFGVDPGTRATGYGVLSARGNELRWIDSGVITPPAKAALDEKLACIYDGLVAKLADSTPSLVCVEQAFYAKNVRTTLTLGHVRGVALLAARKARAPIVEYSPREIKKAVVGNGNAVKDQVMYMVKVLLAPPRTHVHSDAYDALAAALCGFYRYRSPAR